MRNFPMDGVDGRPGKDGEIGPMGPMGPVGPQGERGLDGLVGKDGAMGPVGPIGPVGPKGDIGPIGPVGPRGPKGEQGEKGEAGNEGREGPIGPIPDHQWDKSNGRIRLRFENPDGSWGEWADLTPQKQIIYHNTVIGGSSPPVPPPVDPPVVTIDDVVIDGLSVTLTVSSDIATDLWQIDWGDGGIEDFDTAITEGSHTYLEAGTYTVRVRAHGGGGWSSWVEDEITVSEATGILSLVLEEFSTAEFNLTTYGATDWRQIGSGGGSVKASSPAYISTVSAFGGSSSGGYADSPRAMAWDDGTPTGSATGIITGTYYSSADNTSGGEGSIHADTTLRVARFAVGSYNGTLHIDFTLSDGSAGPLNVETSIIAGASAAVTGVVEIQYRALSDGQTLNYRIWNETAGAFSNASIQGVSLREG